MSDEALQAFLEWADSRGHVHMREHRHSIAEHAWLACDAQYRTELAALRAELQKVRRAAISGMDAATQRGRLLVQQAARLKAESNPDALGSERAANALLTEQLQKAEAEVERLRADAERYRVARRKVCIVGDSFHVINLRPTYVAPDAAIEFDAAIDAAIARGKE